MAGRGSNASTAAAGAAMAGSLPRKSSAGEGGTRRASVAGKPRAAAAEDANGKQRRAGCCTACSPAAWWHWLVNTRHTSLYWAEKAALCVQYGQLFALLWAFARPWPFPFQFRNRTR
jgi:hypothetical protein